MIYKGPYTLEQLTEPGYYWWLPAYLTLDADEPRTWSIVGFSSADPRFHYVGTFFGPIDCPRIGGGVV